MNENPTQERLREIKRSFRLLMNGETSKSMREKGIDYHLNWGVALTDLNTMAKDYGKDYALAVELWKENIRECKILATLIMPAEDMKADLAELWLEQAPNQEMAEMLAFNLFQHLEYAPVLAFEWIAKPSPIYQICGYMVLSRKIAQGATPDERGLCELIDQAETALDDDSVAVRHAAYNCLQKLAAQGDDYAKVINAALKRKGIEV